MASPRLCYPLEAIKLCLKFSSHIAEDQRRSDLAAFEPFVVAQQQAGHPAKVFWSELEVYDVTWNGIIWNHQVSARSRFGVIRR